jgi:ADP-ribose pyrophosphatase
MKNTSWKKLSRKILLEHTRLNVFEDEIELPNGHKIQYIHFGDQSNAAMVIARRKDGKVLLQREYSYPPNKWLYQFPGGGIKDGETPKEGAVREFSEEAGFKGSLSEIGYFYFNNRRSNGKFFVFCAKNLVSCEAKPDDEEDIESYWFKTEEINTMIKNGKIINASALAGWALFKAANLD